ncbi:hypothetical protein BN2476_70096 [Paraburkholderia piptadeniae]|uniref:Uncharacterized protein n=1 Tax=Paraburkholderia piptadeniae TaxID=1701573 RepID=A0A1N7RLP6_9BURK|nr:hypothetical protein BN2476_70096 [Paraburkholderia piptadeniae]
MRKLFHRVSSGGEPFGAGVAGAFDTRWNVPELRGLGGVGWRAPLCARPEGICASECASWTGRLHRQRA